MVRVWHFGLPEQPNAISRMVAVKMTMHIDEALLERVMKDYEFPSKTEAVEAALRELDRQTRIREFRKHGLGLTPDELGAAVDPHYDVYRGRNVYPGESGGTAATGEAKAEADADAEEPLQAVAEPQASYRTDGPAATRR